ncbi:MAG: histidine--tRNA ligase [Clostridia bacterium]|nr:histidine--tRNA ligase [Clostridia bacterium]
MADKIEPRILQGLVELLPKDQIIFNRMHDTIRRVYESFGFLPLDTPVMELSEVLLAKAGGETEKQIYRFKKGDNDISLRFDLTVPLARYVAQHQNDLAFPFKRYQIAKSYRGERPQHGRFREFYQCDIDVIGADSLDLIYDAEMPAIIYNVFKELDICKFTVKINSRKILGGFFDFLSLYEKTTDIIRTIDKLDKIGMDAVLCELEKIGTNGKTDDIIRFLTIDGTHDEVIAKLRELGCENDMFREGVNELEQVIGYMRDFGIPDDYFKPDLTIARGLDYYTGTVYETTLDDYPSLGSVCSGGRYDNLTGYYTDQKLPGIGVSIGLTRLFSQLKEAGLIGDDGRGSIIDVLVIPMDRSVMANALDTAKAFRAAGIPTDVYYQEKGMKPKMKYANRIGVPYVAIIGDEEAKAGKVMLRPMISDGEQCAVTVEEAVKMIKR